MAEGSIDLKKKQWLNKRSEFKMHNFIIIIVKSL